MKVIALTTALVCSVASLTTPAFAQSSNCFNFWVNPRTGEQECLNKISAPTPDEVRTKSSPQNFAYTNLSVRRDGVNPYLVSVNGRLTNTSQETHYIDSVTVELVSGDTTLTQVIIPINSVLAPGKSRLFKHSVDREQLHRTSVRQVTVVPVEVLYR
jgi:hypothetical protein